MSNITDLIGSYAPITLDEMSGIRLMNRIDTKFVTTREMVEKLLMMAREEYFAQDVDGDRLSGYSTTYFDTYDFNMFYVHQTGHANRQKLRFRTYDNSGEQFMEVKTKNNHGRTKKKRMAVGNMLMATDEEREFLAKHLHYDLGTLRPAISNHFNRITLVNRQKTERLTIDLDLRFDNHVSGRKTDVGNFVVIELKRDGLCYSPVLEMLLDLRIHPHGFSKYCMGSVMTNSSLRVNRFKRKMIEVEKLTGCRLLNK